MILKKNTNKSARKNTNTPEKQVLMSDKSHNKMTNDQ